MNSCCSGDTWNRGTSTDSIMAYQTAKHLFTDITTNTKMTKQMTIRAGYDLIPNDVCAAARALYRIIGTGSHFKIARLA
jgi:hypothetical protein